MMMFIMLVAVHYGAVYDDGAIYDDDANGEKI